MSNPLEPAPLPAAAGYESEGEGAAGRDVTAAQAAARAEFRRDTADDEDDFFSSDEESAPTEADSRSVASASVTGSQRFRISIKPAEEAAATPRGDSVSLRNAVQSLRLGGLGSLTGASSAESTPFGTSRSPSLPSGAGAMPHSGSGIGKLGVLPPPPGPAAAAPSSKASSTSGETAATFAVATDDPFAGLFGLPAGGSQAASKLPAAPAAPPASSGPMRPQPPAKPARDLLSGWDEFEALFAAGPTPAAAPAAGAAGGAAAAPSGGFEVSFPPLPGAAAAAAPSAAAQPAAPAPAAKEAAPAGLKKSGSLAELAPAAAGKKVSEALSAFAAGKWDSAAASVGKALDQGAKAGDAAFTQEAAQLFIAARLLAAAVKAPPPAAARLSRFAVSLPLRDESKVAAVSFAVDANMAAHNYGYAADQLTWLVIQSTSGTEATKGLDAMALQDKLNECDRTGASNAALPRDEDREAFAAIATSCGTRAEAEDLLAEILNAK
jgi:hypothetical protein